ncbi:hypothetical protein H6P81_004461 [Aristolochia fimbriata]|uniref:GTP diphosphokinase n=1 Tax=Aristolochia fimbriata TaxID=158543 RepID=A0AAV7FFM3_ARIFI|nr:hypothetical protein H6P81_004461 [Aristolochia fimbriata]
MELPHHAFCRYLSQPISRSGTSNLIPVFQPCRILPPSTTLTGFRLLAAAGANAPAIEQPGGRMVVELVGAFNELTDRMNLLSTSSSRLLFKSLKLCIPLLQALPFLPDGRPPLTRALSVACLLADLQMDAEVISACVLREVLETGTLTILEVKNQISTGTALLLHESLRVKDIPSKVETLDAENAAALRKFCLSYYDPRAVILELACKLDMMKHLDHLPRYHQQKLSLEVMNIYAPLAHAIGTRTLSLELEDLSFRYLFPYSYLYVDTWLRSYHTDNKNLIDIYKEQVLQSLKMDPLLKDLVDDISVKGRYKSRYSTMKKLLKDGRRPEEVHDILGLRVILDPKAGDGMVERGQRACYRTREVIQSMWREIPARTKDYIAWPKANGYESLHMAVDVSDSARSIPLMEIQIRTTEMDKLAVGGSASHALYKGGLTDPEEAKRLKAIMMAAAELAALRLKDLPSNSRGVTMDRRDRVFQLLDKNGDGRISIEELTEVVEELGAEGRDAQELMQLLDANSDGSLSSDEFNLFQKQVEFMRTLDDRDDHYRTMLDEKLQISESNGLIQVYHKALGDQLFV